MQQRNLAILIEMSPGICALLHADVKMDYTRHTDFSRYRTHPQLKMEAGNQLWRDRIMHHRDSALQQKGWQRVNPGGDTTVAAIGKTQSGLGGGCFWGGFGDGIARTAVENGRERTLTVDIFDQSPKKLIWRGTATNSLSGNPEKNEKKLRTDVEDLFKHFPPQPKG